jgi:hypothetical protein
MTFFNSKDFGKIILNYLTPQYAQKLSLVCKNWNDGVKIALIEIINKKVSNPIFMPKKIKFAKKNMEDKNHNICTLWLPVFDHTAFIRYNSDTRWICYKFHELKIDIVIKQNIYYLYYDEQYNFIANSKYINKTPIDHLIPFYIDNKSSISIFLKEYNITTIMHMSLPLDTESTIYTVDELKTFADALPIDQKTFIHTIILMIL